MRSWKLFSPGAPAPLNNTGFYWPFFSSTNVIHAMSQFGVVSIDVTGSPQTWLKYPNTVPGASPNWAPASGIGINSAQSQFGYMYTRNGTSDPAFAVFDYSRGLGVANISLPVGSFNADKVVYIPTTDQYAIFNSAQVTLIAAQYPFTVTSVTINSGIWAGVNPRTNSTPSIADSGLLQSSSSMLQFVPGGVSGKIVGFSWNNSYKTYVIVDVATWTSTLYTTTSGSFNSTFAFSHFYDSGTGRYFRTGDHTSMYSQSNPLVPTGPAYIETQNAAYPVGYNFFNFGMAGGHYAALANGNVYAASARQYLMYAPVSGVGAASFLLAAGHATTVAESDMLWVVYQPSANLLWYSIKYAASTYHVLESMPPV